MKLHKHLEESYHDETFLCDRLLKYFDLPNIQNSLRDRMTRTSKQEINRVENQLSDKPKTAEMASAHLAKDYVNEYSQEDEVMY